MGLVGATGARIVGNRITGNVPGGNTDFSGGVIAVAGAAGNVVQGNIITRNNPDIFWDEVGAGNAFRHNLCGTSTPPGLCH